MWWGDAGRNCAADAESRALVRDSARFAGSLPGGATATDFFFFGPFSSFCSGLTAAAAEATPVTSSSISPTSARPTCISCRYTPGRIELERSGV